MTYQLQLGDFYSWKLRSKLPQDYTKKVKLELVSPFDVIPHERPVAHALAQHSTSELERVMLSIKKNGFIHPILASFEPELNKWALADGTHRVKAMQNLRSHWVPTMVLEENNFDRQTWVKTFPQATTESFLKKIQDFCQEQKLLCKQTRLEKPVEELHTDPDLIAYYHHNDTTWHIKDPRHTERFQHLQLIRQIDDLADTPAKTYITQAEIHQQPPHWLLVPPPRDELGDMKLLIQHPQLRRPKGSRTMISVRPVHFPIAYGGLQKNYRQSLTEVAKAIDQVLQEKALGVLHVKDNLNSVLDESWYGHDLLVGHKDLFARVEGPASHPHLHHDWRDIDCHHAPHLKKRHVTLKRLHPRRLFHRFKP